MRTILASKSPRRKELLGRIVTDFEIITAQVDESLPADVHPRFGVEILAKRKGEAVANENPDALVIASDTLVEYGGRPLGKPTDTDDAVSTLLFLSEKTHSVHTGVAVFYKGEVFSGVDSSRVSFRKIEECEAREYVLGGEPMDKAGSYAIQGEGKKFVSSYEGDYNAIVGLGLSLTERLISEALKNDKG